MLMTILFLSLVPIIMAANLLLKKIVDWHPEYHRKFTHVLLGTSILVATFHLPKDWFIFYLFILSAVAIIGTLLKMGNHYGVERLTFGLLLYPISLLITAHLFYAEYMDAFRFGLIIMTYVDGLTAVVGVKWGKNILPYSKSIVGSVFFFVASLLLSLAFGLWIFPALIVAGVLTYVEFYSSYGIDNLTLPLLASLLFFVLI